VVVPTLCGPILLIRNHHAVVVKSSKLGFVSLLVGVFLLSPVGASPPLDRIGRLVRLLETSHSYKIRMQVVTHLARLKH